MMWREGMVLKSLKNINGMLEKQSKRFVVTWMAQAIKKLRIYLLNFTIKEEGKKMKKPKLGSGERFKSGVEKIEKKGLRKKSASAIMAKAGMKKYGKKKMISMAKKGKDK